MMSRHHFQNIRKYRAQGLNKKQIAEKLGLNWKTVSKYWESNTPPAITERVHRTREDPLQTFHDRIKFLIKEMDSLKAIDIYEQLGREGYSGSLRTVERKVSEIVHRLNSALGAASSS
jgi:predicted transcriptional regulator